MITITRLLILYSMDCRSQQVFLFTFYIKLIVIKAIDNLVRGIKLAEISYDFFKYSEVYMHYGRKTYTTHIINWI